MGKARKRERISWFQKNSQQDASVYQILFEEYPQPTMFITNSGQVMKANMLARSLFHIKSDQDSDDQMTELIHNEEQEMFQSFLSKVNHYGQSVFDGTMQSKKAEMFTVTMVGKQLTDDTIALTVQLRQKNDLDALLYVDSLTQLPNRLFVEEKLKGVTTGNQALFLLNIEYFRFVNENMEYDVRELLLKNVAIRLQSYIGNEGLVACMNDDDFAILLPHYSNVEEVYELAERLLSLFHEPICIHTYEYYLPVYIGISLSSSTIHPTKLIEQARFALYMSKKKGQNHYEMYDKSFSQSSYRSLLLQMGLRKALEQNEFYIVYQPIVEAKTESTIGAEVLLRWNHPEVGIVSPAEFIHLLEEDGLIAEVTYWVLDRVCRQLKQWEEQGIEGLKMSINFAPQHFLETNMLERVSEIVTGHGVNPRQIQIEIVESSFLENESVICHYLNEFSKRGFFIAIDDFGVGYSSLSYLRRFTVHTIKIDKTFIRESLHNKVDFEIIKGLIQVARRLNIQVIAEGIETNEQRLILNSLDCHFLQGFYFSKPLHYEEFEDYMKNKAKKVQLPNKRKYHRLSFPAPVEAFVTIKEYNNQPVSVGQSLILLENISGGGLVFISTIQIPTQADFLLAFTINFLGEYMVLQGTIVWSREVGEGLNRYGVQFVAEEEGSSQVLSFINQLEIHVKKGAERTQLPYIYDSPSEYFKKRNEQIS
ncbi:EAL domain-containing protein [Metabacillus iocasae]|uniref:Diguanylate cyclase (GGDEF)-like protein n=1 Tax=Priestia iocasae TaxID=2291674 RepID=A0ABS2QZ39_9BACI|nr:EAL domain-containing protein [Metabacillus iocasae]MBM7704755.1 diguanylate cyclase (GGDEF)-like protein [Metabacillus iocasae]